MALHMNHRFGDCGCGALMGMRWAGAMPRNQKAGRVVWPRVACCSKFCVEVTRSSLAYLLAGHGHRRSKASSLTRPQRGQMGDTASLC